MARIDSLNILNTAGAKDLLAEKYGPVIENIMKATISGRLKNTELSGDPTTGTVEAKRFVNAVSDPYGTARANAKGDSVKAQPVTVPVNVDREIIEELENKDVTLYGVDNVINRRISNHGRAMERELERAFFLAARTDGAALVPTATAINEITEDLIQSIETTKNDFVDGVPRDLISITMSTAAYGKIRNFLDTDVGNANVNTAAGEFGTFHGVRVFSSVYLPANTSMLAMVDGSVAQPVLPSMPDPGKIQLSDAYGFGIFYYYGTKSVMPDLIQYIAA